MKKSLKILIIVLVVLIVLILILLGVKFLSPTENEDNEMQTNSVSFDANDAVATINAVVVKVNDSDLIAIRVDNPDTLIDVSYPDNVNKDDFKQGQEITVYYNGSTLDSYPERFQNVEKIEVIKDKGDVDIPNSALRYAYSSRDNVNVSVDEITKSKISLTITDNNEYKYEYSNEYKLYKKNKDNNEQAEAPNMPVATGNTTSSFDGTGPVWDEVTKVSNASNEIAGNVENTDDITTKMTADWTSIYGELSEGDDEFVLDTSEAFSVIVYFTVNSNGEISNINTSLS